VRSLRKSAIAALVFSVLPAFASAQSSQPAASQPPTKPWWERISFFGDFRARYEGFFLEDTATRHRQRFRLRFGMHTGITDDIGLTVRLATGESNDIGSTNQTLTSFYARKPINIDQATIAWSPKQVKSLAVGFGKFAYPVARTQLVWDDDINWEGVYEQYSLPLGERTTLRLAAAQTPLNETVGGDDASMWAEQVQAAASFGKHQVQVALADYAFGQIDQLAVALARLQIIAANTNATTTGPDGLVNGFLSDFNIVDLLGQATLSTASSQYPVQLVAEWAHNTRAETDEDTAVWFVGGIGRAATARTAAATYTYTRIERDAVISAFRFAEMPGTNIIGQMVTGSYMPVNRVNLDVAVILTKPLVAPPDTPRRTLTRLQVDARFTF
jgi:Putative porin